MSYMISFLMHSTLNGMALDSSGARVSILCISTPQNSCFSLLRINSMPTSTNRSLPFPVNQPISCHPLPNYRPSLRPLLSTCNPAPTPQANPTPTLTIPTPSILAPRKAKEGSNIANSSLHPNVRAKDRIHAWNTPYSITKRQETLNTYPANIIELAEKAMQGGLADSTKSSYAAGLLRFNQFCNEFNIPEILRMPASEDLITGFIGFHMGKVSGASIKGWLSGLRAWHDLHGAPWPSESRRIRFAQTGSHIAGAHRKRPIRNPITLAHMLALFFAINFNDSYGR
jgi:hypothetical protein